MTVAAVVLARDACEHPQLPAGELAVRHGDAQHRRVALDVPAVLQPQRAQLVVGELAARVALELVPELPRAFADELAVEGGVAVHGPAL